MSFGKPGPTDSPQPAKRRRLPSWIQDIFDRPSSPPWPLFWFPPEDPHKPDLPYTVGFTVDIHRERAPTAAALRPALPRDYLETVTHSEAVLASAPVKSGPEADTNTEPADCQNEMAKLVITAQIAVGAERGAQVVAVTVTPSSKDKAPRESYNAVAKIYDPLYYSFDSRIGHHPEDCVYSAGRDYIHEASAYEHLWLAGQTGTFAPEYYGSWSCNLPITIRGSPQTRNINLILMESLEGNSILSTRIQNNPDRPRVGFFPLSRRVPTRSTCPRDGRLCQAAQSGDCPGRLRSTQSHPCPRPYNHCKDCTWPDSTPCCPRRLKTCRCIQRTSP